MCYNEYGENMDWLDFKEFVKDTISYVAFIIVVIVIAIYVVGLQQVVGPSMQTTLNNNDVVILDKISYRFSEIKRGDIVALYYADTKFLIKRVIGLPGETIEYKENNLYIDGEKVKEKYLEEDTKTEDFNLSSLGVTKIPKDQYLVLGDNRENSMDSRDKEVGLIKKEDIIGKARLRIWPITKITLF